MSTKSRQTIYGGAIMGAEIRARSARETAKKAAREADRAEWMLLKAASSVGAKTACNIGAERKRRTISTHLLPAGR
jgi:hypothetical protein